MDSKPSLLRKYPGAKYGNDSPHEFALRENAVYRFHSESHFWKIPFAFSARKCISGKYCPLFFLDNKAVRIVLFIEKLALRVQFVA